jgi:hypothetical protein
MIDSARLFTFLKFIVPAAVFILSLAYLSGGPKTTYNTFLRQFRTEKKAFVVDFLENEIDGHFDGAPIRHVCDSRKWTPGFILSCGPQHGGVGEVKNAHLHCVRIAMELGGSHIQTCVVDDTDHPPAELILPEIVRRSDNDITKVIPNTVGPPRGTPMDYFFDVRHLNESLAKACPQMKLHSSINDLHNVPSMLTPVKFGIRQVTKDFVNGTVLARPGQLGKEMQDYIDNLSPPSKRTYPFRVHIEPPTFMFPTAYDPPDFQANFGRIIRIRSDIRALAGSALFNMQKMFQLNLDPRNGIKNESFIGVHLRTEKDVEDKFPSYEKQAADYLNLLVQHNMKVVFLATGASGNNITAFTERAADFGAKVVMKKDVLEGEDADALSHLSWDQRGLVDYEIMLRAGLVTGISDSSFAWNLAMRRANAYGGLGKSHFDSSDIMYKDQYSVIFGNSSAGESMQLTIWP